MLLNGADRAVLGLAAVPILKELGLTPAEYGVLSGTVFFLFGLAAIMVGPQAGSDSNPGALRQARS
jgi:hypothetical protein